MGEPCPLPDAKRARLQDAAGASLLPDQTTVYPGEEGSLAHIAATQFFKNFPQTRFLGVSSFAKAFAAVAKSEVLYGVIPIENSASGTLHVTYDLLVSHDVVIGGELGVKETYCLCAEPGVELAAIGSVLSHPNILEACSAFIQTRLKEEAPDLISTRSTTEAARRVAGGLPSDAASRGGGSAARNAAMAAIAPREAAARFKLGVLAEDIGNDAFLETRYILIHRRSGWPAMKLSPFPLDASSPIRKQSACFVLRNEPGSIFKLLSCWALRNIDVLKVETRPLGAGRCAPPGLPAGMVRLWEYLFYVDYVVPPCQSEEEGRRLWAALSEFSLWQCDLGVYPSHLTLAEKLPQSWAEMVDLMAKC